MRTNVVVTGASGFIGSNLSAALSKRGYTVVGVDREKFLSPLVAARESFLENNFVELRRCDVRDKQDLIRVFEDVRPDYVFHLAGLAGVRDSFIHPQEYFDVNVLGSLNIIQVAELMQVKRVFLASSSSVYGDVRAGEPSSETDAIDAPASPYAASKTAMEIASRAMDPRGQRHTSLRFFTVFGPYGRPDMAIWKFTRSLLLGREIPIFGDGSYLRDFTNIETLTGKLLHLLQLEIENCLGDLSVINCGGGRPISVLSLVEELSNQLGTLPKIEWLASQRGDVFQTCSSTKLQDQLGLTNFDESTSAGIAKWIEWVRENQEIVLSENP
jgi:UDP-glucuronate 4-epimerase